MFEAFGLWFELYDMTVSAAHSNQSASRRFFWLLASDAFWIIRNLES